MTHTIRLWTSALRHEPARDHFHSENPTFHPTYQTDTTGPIRRHRTMNSAFPGRNRHHWTSPTDCSHLIIPRSWVRSPPALLIGPSPKSSSSSVRRLLRFCVAHPTGERTENDLIRFSENRLR